MIPDRIKNCYYIAERDETPWVRPKEFREKELPRPVVLVNGGFDLLHSGHMKMLFRARRHAGEGTLIVALDSDERMRRKGKDRPILTYVERATALGFMPVDYICEIESDQDMLDLIRSAKVDLRCQGPEYRKVPSKYPWVKKVYISGVGKTGKRLGMSTTRIVERIRKQCQ